MSLDTKNVKGTKLYQVQFRLVNFEVGLPDMNLYQINLSAPAWKTKCTLGNEVPQHGIRASKFLPVGFLLASDLELIKNVNAAVMFQSLPQLRWYTSKTVKNCFKKPL